MVTLEELATKGSRNYARKIPTMKSGYPKAESRAIAGYNAAPFGSTRKAAYSAAWSTMKPNYDTMVVPGLESKWATAWKAKMAE